MAGLRIIKKYPNRRLYDTEISSYITIEDVRQLIIDGEEFEVRDAKSGEDLSRAVLLQIIADREQDGEPMLSTQLLSQIIRFYGDSLQGFMGNYLERSMQVPLKLTVVPSLEVKSNEVRRPWTVLTRLSPQVGLTSLPATTSFSQAPLRTLRVSGWAWDSTVQDRPRSSRRVKTRVSMARM